MEKFSKWRDAGTGIAPFITPLPTTTSVTPFPIRLVATPLSWILGGARTAAVVLLLIVHFLLVEVLLKLCLVIPPVHDICARILTTVLIRLVLLLLGFVSIPVEEVSLKRTSRSQPAVPFAPTTGDIIVANSSSEIDLLYLAFRCFKLLLATNKEKFLIPLVILSKVQPNVPLASVISRIQSLQGLSSKDHLLAEMHALDSFACMRVSSRKK
ncbi:hypothetical protein P7C70_g6981, partial [Phenoliferia sp. Uapishka_3]